MTYLKFSDAGKLDAGVYVGAYKQKRALLHVDKNGLHRIVLDDATHLYGEAMRSVNEKEIMIYVPAYENGADQIRKINEQAEVINKQAEQINEQWKRINDYAANEDENKRAKLTAERILNEKQHRHNAQLRAIFYMLEQLEKVGTHHEKAVVIGYIRKCIHEYIIHDGLDDYGYDELTF